MAGLFQTLMGNFEDDDVTSETKKLLASSKAQSQKDLVQVPKGYNPNSEAQEIIGRVEARDRKTKDATVASKALDKELSTLLAMSGSAAGAVGSTPEGEKLIKDQATAKAVKEASETRATEDFVNIQKSLVTPVADKTKNVDAQSFMDNLDWDSIVGGKGSTNDQTTSRLSTEEAFKRSQASREAIKIANDSTYVMDDGRNILNEYQIASDKARAAIERLAESRANNPIRHLLFDDDTFFAKGEVESAIQRLGVLRENLEQVRGSRKNTLDFVQNFQNEIIKQAGSTMQLDPESERSKADAQTFLAAMVASHNKGNMSIDITSLPDPVGHALKFGEFLASGGQKHKDLFETDSQGILDNLYGENFVDQIDVSNPYVSILENKNKYPVGSLRHERLADVEATITLDFAHAKLDPENKKHKDYIKAFNGMNKQEQAMEINKYAQEVSNSYSSKGLQGLIEQGANPYVADVQSIMLDNLPADDEFFKSWMDTNPYSGSQTIGQWSSNMLDNTRTYVNNIENPTERRAAIETYARSIQKTYKEHRELVDMNSNLFFSLKNKPYMFTIEGSKAFQGSLPLDFSNFGQVVAFLSKSNT